MSGGSPGIRHSARVAAAPSAVHVRDSKDLAGPQLGFTSAAWADFVPYASGSESGS
ncbi:DUF397 domain-containing protein [Streptomyces sp. NPDC054874]